MSPSKSDIKLTREQFLLVTGGSALTFALAALGFRERTTIKRQEPWPTDPENILKRIKELNFPVGSELRTTIFPRKIMWEAVQVLKANGEWTYDIDESDWLRRLDIFEEHIARLAANGI